MSTVEGKNDQENWFSTNKPMEKAVLIRINGFIAQTIDGTVCSVGREEILFYLMKIRKKIKSW